MTEYVWTNELVAAAMAAGNGVGFGQGAGMPSYMPLPVSPYNYVPGKTGDGAGIGVDDLAFVQWQTIPVDSIYAPRYNVLKSLAPIEGGYVNGPQDKFVQNDLLANGLYFSGPFLLTPLSPQGDITPRSRT